MMQTLFKRVMTSGLYGLLARVSLSVSQIVFIPFMIDLFGKQEYGILITLISLNSFVSLSNFGVSKSMQNKIAKFDQETQYPEVSQTFIESATFIGKWTLNVCILILSTYLIFDSIYHYDITILVAIFLISAFLTVQLNTILDFYRGCQRPDFANKIALLISVCTILLTSMTLVMEVSIHYFFLTVHVIPPLLVILCFYGKKISLLNNYKRRIKGDEEIAFDRTAKLFFVLTVIQFFGFGFDTFLVSSYLGAEQAADYNIVLRFYNFLLFGFSVFSSSLWPFFTKLHHENKFDEMRGLIQKGSVGTFLYGIATAFILALLVPLVVTHIMKIQIDSSIYFALSIQLIIVVFTSLIIPILNSMNLLEVQIKFGLINISVNVLLSLVLMNIYGVAGTSIATAFAHFVFGAIPLGYCLYKELNVEHKVNLEK